jgi:hypothetical protein
MHCTVPIGMFFSLVLYVVALVERLRSLFGVRIVEI